MYFANSAGTPGEVGTTLIAATFQPEGLHWISVGDSALFLFRDGQFLQVNTNHTYGNILDVRAYRGEITRELALSDPQREALTSYVGTRELRDIDANVRPLPIQHGDIFALASDGLFKTLPQEQIVFTIAAGPDGAALQLVNRTIEAKRQSQDNVTVCTVRAVDPEKIAPQVVEKKLEATEELPAVLGSQKKFVAFFILAAVLAAAALIGAFLYFHYHAPSPKTESRP